MAFVLGLGFMIAMSSFKGELKAPTVYYYNHPSDNFADMEIPANWNTAQDIKYTCAGIADIPCSVTVPDGGTIDTYLSNYTTLPKLLEAAKNNRENQ
jgi:hypothetical protein